jgi:hypothetical protein
MLGKKIGLMAIGAVLAMFAIGQAGSLIAHRGFAGSTAWAQDDEAPDAAIDSTPPTVPDVSGTYSGQIDDHRKGNGTISATIGQSGNVLSGTWSSDLKAGGKLSGKVNASSDVTMTLKLHGKPGCSLHASGTFENGDEISMVFIAVGCHHSDHGTIDMTD